MATKQTTITRTTRTDDILLLRQKYTGKLNTPRKYNKAFSAALREVAAAIEAVDDAWVDPEVVVWMHEAGMITAEARLSPPA